MCGGGGGISDLVNTSDAPPGPGANIGNVPIGYGNYQDAAKALMSTGKTYGQMASLAAQNMQGQAPMAAPPAPQSAFDGGIGQYLASGGASPAMGQSPATSAIGQLEAEYDPRTSAMEMLESYEPAFEARPLSYYTPSAMEALEKANKEAEAKRSSQLLNRRGGGDRGNNVGGGRGGIGFGGGGGYGGFGGNGSSGRGGGFGGIGVGGLY